MNNETIIFTTPWVVVKETNRGFYYLERKGRDSVAIFLLRQTNNPQSPYEILI